jgi:hypothetical protein
MAESIETLVHPMGSWKKNGAIPLFSEVTPNSVGVISSTHLTRRPLFLVGVRRLELPTPCTPCKCASQLRHTPILCKEQNFEKLQTQTGNKICSMQVSRLQT